MLESRFNSSTRASSSVCVVEGGSSSFIELGLHSMKLGLPASTTQTELLARVEELNRDSSIHGILVQSPPPEHIDEAAIARALDPHKDVDGFHRENVAKLVLEDPSGFVPCTPLGVQRLLIENN